MGARGTAVRIAAALTVVSGCLASSGPETEPSGSVSLTGDAGAGAGSKLRIAQVYAGGGLPDAPFQRDFVEFFNAGRVDERLEGKTLQIARATDDFIDRPDGGIGTAVLRLPATVIPPGGTFTLALGGEPDAGGADVPSSVPVQTKSNLPAFEGKIALVVGKTPLGCRDAGKPCVEDVVIDAIAYGPSATSVEGKPVAALGPKLAAHRVHLCRDTNENADDFEVRTPKPTPLDSIPGVCAEDGGLVDAEPPEAAPPLPEAGPREAGPRERDSAPDQDDTDPANDDEADAQLAPFKRRKNQSRGGCSAAHGEASPFALLLVVGALALLRRSRVKPRGMS